MIGPRTAKAMRKAIATDRSEVAEKFYVGATCPSQSAGLRRCQSEFEHTTINDAPNQVQKQLDQLDAIEAKYTQ